MKKNQASKQKRGRQLRSTGWLDALAKSWERRSRNKKLYGEIYSQALKDCALELQIKSIRADCGSASNDRNSATAEPKGDNGKQ